MFKIGSYLCVFVVVYDCFCDVRHGFPDLWRAVPENIKGGAAGKEKLFQDLRSAVHVGTK